MKKAIPISIIVVFAIIGIYYLWAQFTYSEGNRAGTLIKFSKKGYIFKTYEGEINQIGLNADARTGLVNNIWDFSVIDAATAEKLSHLEGKSVSLHYKQVNKNFIWQGETNYFVDNVTEITK